jgi:hypothetical protein
VKIIKYSPINLRPQEFYLWSVHIDILTISSANVRKALAFADNLSVLEEGMNKNILRKHAIVLTFIGFLLSLPPVTAMSKQQIKPPEWVLDTIILPEKKNTKIIDFSLYKDKKNEIVYNYATAENLHNRKVFNFSTHKEIDPNTLELFSNPKTNDFFDGLKKINPEIIQFERFAVPDTIYEIKMDGRSTICEPIGAYLTFITQAKSESYMFLLSFEKGFKFESDDQCSWMNGKQKINIDNLGVYPSIWIVDDNRLLLGDDEKPFFIVIDINKIDLALLERKTPIFDHNGVKGYWVKESIIDECIKRVLDELFAQYGYDIYSDRPLKGNMSINEFIDQEITKELNKPD